MEMTTNSSSTIAEIRKLGIDSCQIFVDDDFQNDLLTFISELTSADNLKEEDTRPNMKSNGSVSYDSLSCEQDSGNASNEAKESIEQTGGLNAGVYNKTSEKAESDICLFKVPLPVNHIDMQSKKVEKSSNKCSPVIKNASKLSRNDGYSCLQKELLKKHLQHPQGTAGGDTGNDNILTPKITISKTPFTHLTPLSITPLLMKLTRDSPMLTPGSAIPLQILSTPALVQATATKTGVPDMISLIDDDSKKVTCLERKLDTFTSRPLQDSGVVDYVLEITDDYAQNNSKMAVRNVEERNICSAGTASMLRTRSRAPPSWHANVRLTELPIENRRTKCGHHCKRMPADIEKEIENQQKEKRQESVLQRKTKRKRKFLKESNEEVLQRRIQTSGRRTRSLVRTARAIGKTEDDLNSMFSKTQTVCPDEE